MRPLFLVLLMVVFTPSAFAEFDTGFVPDKTKFDYSGEKIVFAINTELAKPEMARLAGLISYIKEVSKKIDIKVVVRGPAVKLFVGKDKEANEMIDISKKAGAQFLLCNNSLRGGQLKIKDLYKVTNEDVVPAGILELARLQRLGYSFLPVI